MSIVRRASVWIGLGLLLAGSAGAQPQEGRWIDPHTSVSSDGTVRSRAEVDPGIESEEAFAGYGAEIEELGATFDETGAALDGAAEVSETAEEMWKLWETSVPVPGSIHGGSIIGPDSRTLVSPTTTFPARAIVLITFTGGRCTGWLYGRNIVATAGHCVHSGGSGGSWRSNVRVYPGRNGGSAPYGSCTATQLWSVLGWTSSKDEKYDYGAIKLSCNIGDTLGWFGYFWQSASLNGISATIAGYPGDKPLTQWKATGAIAVSQDRQIFFKHDTVNGQSGAPVYYNKSGCGGPCSMAIHAYGLHGSSPHSTNNHATRINKAVFDNLYAWKNN